MSKGFDQHLVNLRVLFERMEQYDLKLKPSKCYFAQKSVSFLGHQISEDGIIPDPERTRSLKEFKVPATPKDVRSFLGFCSFYRRFIQNFSTIAQPLNQLLKKNQPFVWGQEQQMAFEALKEKVLTPPVLCHYDPEATLILRTDSSGYGLGANLVQAESYEKRKSGRLLACTSRTLSAAERNYSINELECLAIVFAIDKFRCYLFKKKFYVETDHCALCFLMKIKNPNGRLCRWSILLQGYDFEVRYNSGAKHVDADCLSRYTLAASLRDMDCDYFKDLEIHPSVLAFEEEPRVVEVTPNTFPDMAEEQRNDPLLRGIIETLHLEDHENQNSYFLQEDVLYHRSERDGRVYYTLCVHESRIKDVLTAHHDCPTAGHIGRDKAFLKIQSLYYWRHMYKDIQEYIKSCHECQRYKASNQQRAGLYKPLPVESRPFKSIAMDIIGPLDTTSSGNTYILSIVCQFTKFAFAWPLPDTRDRTVIKIFLDHFIYKYGICETLLTDRGANLCSEYSEGVYKSLGIKHKTTTAYHPECNGQVENFNKFITTCVAIHRNLPEVDWDDCLADVVYAYNTAPNDTTKKSPYFLVFGVEPRGYLENLFQFQELQEEPMLRDEQLIRMSVARLLARDAIKKSQAKNMRRVNQKRKNVEYHMGDRVLLQMKHLKTTKGGKLKPKYSGHYVVVKKLGPLTYRLAKLKGPYKSSVVHVKRLKLYNKRRTVSEPEIVSTSSTDADDEEDEPLEVEIENYWEEPEPAEAAIPTRSTRVRRKPDRLRDFVCYLYNKFK